MEKIPLQNKLDTVSYPTDKWKRKLKGFLGEDIGCILLSGDRGIGKTRLLKDVEKELKQEAKAEFIWINALQISGKDEEKGFDELHILKYIVEELDRLKLPYSKDFEEIKENLYTAEQLVTRDNSTNIQMNGGKIPNMKLGISQSDTAQNKWLGYSTIQLSSALSNYLQEVEDLWKYSKLRKVQNSVSNRLKSLFRFLSSIFRDPLRQIVFVFDELDNFDENPDKILQFIKNFKNLFTLSRTSFVFITSPKLVSYIGSSDSIFSGNPKDVHRTLFTHQLYINKYIKEEILKFLKEIFGDKEDNKEILDFLAIKSQGNIFNLKREIKKRLEYDNNANASYDATHLDKTILKKFLPLYRIIELVIKDKNLKDPYLLDIAWAALYNFTNDYWKYLNNYYIEEKRPKKKDIASHLKQLGNEEESLLTKLEDNLFETLSYVVMGEISDPNFIEKDTPMPWDKVATEIEKVANIDSLTGTINPLERQFVEKHLILLQKLKQTFKVEESELMEVVVRQGILSNQQKLDLARGEEVLELPLSERDPSSIRVGMTILSDIENKLPNFWRYTDNLLLRKDSGLIEFYNDKKVVELKSGERSENDLATKLYIHAIDTSKINKFTFECVAYSNHAESLLNIIFVDGGSRLENFTSNSFYCIRADFRHNNNPGQGNGILRKNINSPVSTWGYINNKEVRESMPLAKDVKIQIKYLNNKLSYRYKWGNKKWSRYETVDTDAPIFHILMSNELGPVQIKDMNIVY